MAVYQFAGGIDPVQAHGMEYKITFAGAWIEGETWSVLIASTQGDFTLGLGWLRQDNGGAFSCGLTLNNRVYVGNGKWFNFSGIVSPSDSTVGDPTGWNEQNLGAGRLPYLGYYGTQDSVKALGQIQGKLAVFGRYSVQIWNVDADPANFLKLQTLENIGTIAQLSVQAIGDLDLLFLDSTGVRSLRTRELNLNAYVEDVGSPVDSLVRAQIKVNTEAQMVSTRSAVEPETKQYWLYLPNGNFISSGPMYVLSQFPESKIRAWSVFTMVDENGAQFAPQCFVLHNGKVYIRTADRVYIYGGTNGVTYDATVGIWQLPWLDAGTPTTLKALRSVDVAMSGSWTLSVGLDPMEGTLTEVWIETSTSPNEKEDSTFGIQRIAHSALGTHVTLRGVSGPAAQVAKVSNVSFMFDDVDQS